MTIENYPLGFFAIGIGLAAGVVVRRLWRLHRGSRELDRAEQEGRLSSDLRRRWDRQNLYLILSIFVSIFLTLLMLYGIDNILRD